MWSPQELEISALVKETPENILPFPPYEDIAGRWWSMNQEVESPQTLNLLTP